MTSCQIFQSELKAILALLRLPKLTTKDFQSKTLNDFSACSILRQRLKPLHIDTRFMIGAKLLLPPVTKFKWFSAVEKNKYRKAARKNKSWTYKGKLALSNRQIVQHMRKTVRLYNPKTSTQYEIRLNVKTGKPVLKSYPNSGLFSVSKFVDKVFDTSFHKSVKSRLIFGLLAAIVNGPRAVERQVTANIDFLLRNRLKKNPLATKGWLVYQVFGNGVFGLTLGIQQIKRKKVQKRALKLVMEEKMDNFKKEMKLHRKFAAHGLAPRIFDKDFFVGTKKIAKRIPMAYTMEKIDGLAADILSGDRQQSELRFFAIELARLIKEMAAIQMVHGDMHMDNVAIKDKKLMLIDFGYSDDSHAYKLYDMMQCIRGLLIQGSENVEKCSHTTLGGWAWACDNYKRMFNRIYLCFRVLYNEFYNNLNAHPSMSLKNQKKYLNKLLLAMSAARKKMKLAKTPSAGDKIIDKAFNAVDKAFTDQFEEYVDFIDNQ